MSRRAPVGGKIAGDPNMPVVANLTPHETGLKGWTEADFFRALREGKRKDGTGIRPQMPWKAYGQMNDVELVQLTMRCVERMAERVGFVPVVPSLTNDSKRALKPSARQIR